MRHFKKIAALAITMGMAASLHAQNFERGVFNHLGVNAGVGLEGISIGVATPLTKFLEIEGGVDIMPGMLRVSGDIDVPEQRITVTEQGQSATISTPETSVDAKAKFSRTMIHLKANVYPFGGNSSFFIAAGCSFGGKKIAKLSGRDDELKQWAERNYPEYLQQISGQASADLADYDLKFDDDFAISGDIRCNGFRPYLGLGFGRLVPKKRIGFRTELGCQFMGRMKVYQHGKQLDTAQLLDDADVDDSISKFIENWRWYPCFKLAITGRIL